MKMKPLTAFCALNMGQSPSSETYNEKTSACHFSKEMPISVKYIPKYVYGVLLR